MAWHDAWRGMNRVSQTMLRCIVMRYGMALPAVAWREIMCGAIHWSGADWHAWQSVHSTLGRDVAMSALQRNILESLDLGWGGMSRVA